MNKMKSHSSLKKNLKIFLSVVVALTMLVIGLGSYQYRTLVINPKTAIEGTKTLLTGGSEQQKLERLQARVNRKYQEFLQTSDQENEVLNEQNVSNQSAFEQIDQAALVANTRDQVAQFESIQARIAKDQARLEEAEQSVNDAMKSLESIDQDFSELAAFQLDQQARKQAIEKALEEEIELPSESEVEELIAEHKSKLASSIKGSESGDVSGIPENVVNSVERSMGLSREEIERIVNQ